MSALVRINGVHKSFTRGSERIDVLKGVNLEIPRGDFLALMGPSGSGKTTLLNLIGGLDAPTGGSVDVAGVPVSSLGGSQLSSWRAQNIGFVFQLYHLLPVLTAEKNVELPLVYRSVPRAERGARAKAMLERVGLGHRLHHRSHQLSGGQRQRVAIARALVAEPSLLLADEPTGNLDTASGAGVLELLHGLHAAGTTVVVITHDREIATGLHRQVHMRDGLVVRDTRDPVPAGSGVA